MIQSTVVLTFNIGLYNFQQFHANTKICVATFLTYMLGTPRRGVEAVYFLLTY